MAGGVTVGLEIDHEMLRGLGNRLTGAYARAGWDAVDSSVKWLERELEAVTRSAVGGNLWRAWDSRFYPNDGKRPAGIVFVSGSDRARGAMAFWSRPGKITSKDGGWLAIPTDAVPRRGRGRRRALTPVEWEAMYNQELQFVRPRGSRKAMLVARGVTNARTGTYRPITRKRTQADVRRGFVRREQTIVLYILVPAVAFGNRFAIEPVVNRARGRLVEEFVTRVSNIGGRG